MKNAVLERWLVRQALSEAFLNIPVGVICLAASLVALSIATAIAWAAGFVFFLIAASVLKSAFDVHAENSTLFCAIFCAAFLVWIFVSHYRRNLENLRFAKYRTAKVHVSNTGFARALNILLAGPNIEDGIFQRMLYSGPQWFVAAISMFYKSWTLLRMDIGSCAKILLILFKKGSRVSFTELAQLAPEINGIKIFPQLRDIAGVIFLQSEPSRISLTSDLRAELARVLGVKIAPEPKQQFYQRREAPPPPKPRVEEEPPAGPHRILGVSMKASPAEIKAAYRKQIKQCHPDRFATLNKDWQQMAEQRAKAVNAAYDELMARYGNQRSAE